MIPPLFYHMRQTHRSKNASKAPALKDTNEIAVVKTSTGKIIHLNDGTVFILIRNMFPSFFLEEKIYCLFMLILVLYI